MFVESLGGSVLGFRQLVLFVLFFFARFYSVDFSRLEVYVGDIKLPAVFCLILIFKITSWCWGSNFSENMFQNAL